MGMIGVIHLELLKTLLKEALNVFQKATLITKAMKKCILMR